MLLNKLSTAIVIWPLLAATAQAEVNTFPELQVHARLWAEDQHQSPVSVTVLADPDQLTAPDLDLEALNALSANIQIEQSSVQQRLVVRGISAANTGLQIGRAHV